MCPNLEHHQTKLSSSGCHSICLLTIIQNDKVLVFRRVLKDRRLLFGKAFVRTFLFDRGLVEIKSHLPLIVSTIFAICGQQRYGKSLPYYLHMCWKPEKNVFLHPFHLGNQLLCAFYPALFIIVYKVSNYRVVLSFLILHKWRILFRGSAKLGGYVSWRIRYSVWRVVLCIVGRRLFLHIWAARVFMLWNLL